MERPILFSTPMVQAILDGRKTQTRRIIPVQPQSFGEPQSSEDAYKNEALKRCRFGKTGDILWVRETWTRGKICFTDTENPADSEAYVDQCKDDNDIIYKEVMISNMVDIEGIKWKPSIFMPKEACRIKLLIKDIRVERVQDISNEDALAEGINISESPCIEPMNAYAILWDSINGNGSWSKNPWVWVIEFRIKDK